MQSGGGIYFHITVLSVAVPHAFGTSCRGSPDVVGSGLVAAEVLGTTTMGRKDCKLSEITESQSQCSPGGHCLAEAPESSGLQTKTKPPRYGGS